MAKACTSVALRRIRTRVRWPEPNLIGRLSLSGCLTRLDSISPVFTYFLKPQPIH